MEPGLPALGAWNLSLATGPPGKFLKKKFFFKKESTVQEYSAGIPPEKASLPGCYSKNFYYPHLKSPACNVGVLGSIPWTGRSSGEGNGNPLQYSCLENLYGQRSLVGYSPRGRKELELLL